MPFPYAFMRRLAGDLLAWADQGGLELLSIARKPADEFWQPASDTVTVVKFAGTVRGVTVAEIDGDLIHATDLVVVVPGEISTPPRNGDRIRISGRELQIVRIEPKPAQGVIAAWLCFVRA